MSLFGSDPHGEAEVFAPAVYEGHILPAYQISNRGNMIGRFNKPIKGSFLFRKCPTTGKRIPTAHSFQLNIPLDLVSSFYREGYIPANHGPVPKRGRRKARKQIMTHRCVMETFSPLGSCPIEYWTQEEWDNTPDAIKAVLRSTMQVDHIDADPHNNDIRNLRWVTMKDNNHRVKQTLLEIS